MREAGHGIYGDSQHHLNDFPEAGTSLKSKHYLRNTLLPMKIHRQLCGTSERPTWNCHQLSEPCLKDDKYVLIPAADRPKIKPLFAIDFQRASDLHTYGEPRKNCDPRHCLPRTFPFASLISNFLYSNRQTKAPAGLCLWRSDPGSQIPHLVIPSPPIQQHIRSDSHL